MPIFIRFFSFLPSLRLPLLTDLTNSSMMKTEYVVLASAAAVISGTILLLGWRLRKSLHHHPSPPIPQSCKSSASDEEEKKKKKKRRVHFAEDVVVSSRTRREGRNEEVRRNYRVSSETKVRNGGNEDNRGMPANRVALYNGILRDRADRRLARLTDLWVISVNIL